MLDQGAGRTRRAFLDQIPGREKEPGKLPDSFKIHLLKTVVKLQRLMAGSCDNVILLFLGQADELRKVLNGCRHNYLVSINTSITASSSS